MEWNWPVFWYWHICEISLSISYLEIILCTIECTYFRIWTILKNEDDFNLEIVIFLKLTQSLVFDARREIKVASFMRQTLIPESDILSYIKSSKCRMLSVKSMKILQNHWGHSLKWHRLMNPQSHVWFIRTFVRGRMW